jgi:hypothetical protein
VRVGNPPSPLRWGWLQRTWCAGVLCGLLAVAGPHGAVAADPEAAPSLKPTAVETRERDEVPPAPQRRPGHLPLERAPAAAQSRDVEPPDLQLEALAVPFKAPKDGAASPSQCLASLTALDAVLRVEKSFSTEKGCLVDDPVRVLTVGPPGAPIALPSAPTLNCTFAATFGRWLSQVVQPLAEHHLGTPITRVQVGPGYTCRFRNNARGGKLSEHAFGNAIDILGFQTADGATLSVLSYPTASPAQRAFLEAARTTACGYFTTVLGPGANAAHENHFHLDLGRHGRTDNYKICE